MVLRKKLLLILMLFLMRRKMTAMKLHFTLQSVRRRKYMLIYLQCLKEARKHYNENFIERERVTW